MSTALAKRVQYHAALVDYFLLFVIYKYLDAVKVWETVLSISD